MRYYQVVGHFGGLTKAGNALGLDRRRVHEWKKRGIPSFWQLKIEHVTDGDLQADRKAKLELAEYAKFLAPRPAAKRQARAA